MVKKSVFKHIRVIASSVVFIAFLHGVIAQVVIGGIEPDSSAILDIQSDSRGLLLPRLTQGQRDAIQSPAQGLQIFNLTSVCLEINVGEPDDPIWVELKCKGLIDSFQCAQAMINSDLLAQTPIDQVILKVPYTGLNRGAYPGRVLQSSGVAGVTAELQRGYFTEGFDLLEIELSGTPQDTGMVSFEFNLGGQTCEIVLPVYAPGLVSELLCDQAVVPSYFLVGKDVDTTVTIPYNGGNGGRYSSDTILSTEIEGLQMVLAGGTLAHGSGSLEYALKGSTPQKTGMATFDLAIVGDSCQITVAIDSGLVNELLCDQAVVPSYFLVGEDVDTTMVLPYNGGNGGPYSSDTILSTGVEGLQMVLDGGAFALGDGSLNFILSGTTPFETGVAAFHVEVGGKICEVAIAVDSGLVSELPCTIIDNLIITPGESIDTLLQFPYSGGNGGPYSGDTIESAGITGYTLSWQGGNFEIGDDTVQLRLTGMSDFQGFAEFQIGIGGAICDVDLIITPFPAEYVRCDPANLTVVQDVTNPVTNQTWMDRNLGAKRVATAYNDAEAYGDLYQWGRFAEGHQCRNSPNTNTNATTALPNSGNSWDGKFIVEGSAPYDWLDAGDNNLWQGVNGANNPCPGGYRLPTESELEAERQSWGQKNQTGAYASPLRFTSPGARALTSGTIASVGSYGAYWSSLTIGSGVRTLVFYSGYANIATQYRAYGYSVRCLKN